MRRFTDAHVATALAGFLCITAYSASLLFRPAQAQIPEEAGVIDILKGIPADEDLIQHNDDEWRCSCTEEYSEAVSDYPLHRDSRPNIDISQPITQSPGIPAPEYPMLARAARISGEVKVEVMVDETGRVIFSRVVSGHPLLAPAAAKAGCDARFSSPNVPGIPIKVRGLITYNFVLD